MKVRLIGHITYDAISLKDDKQEEYVSVGGPPVYSGLLLSKFGINPCVTTRFGPDFDDSKVLWLSRNGFQIDRNAHSKNNTTKFRIQIDTKSKNRTMYLVSKCDDIIADEYEGDVCLLQPVMNELDAEEIEKARKRCSFLFLDPQGFLRISLNGMIQLSANGKLLRYLKYVDAIKVDVEEGRIITGSDDFVKIGKRLLRLGVREAIVTLGASATYLFTKDTVYSVAIPAVKFYDGIGAGDMLGASYAYSRQSMNHAESLAFAVSAAVSRLDRKALDKVPSRKEIEETMNKIISSLARID